MWGLVLAPGCYSLFIWLAVRGPTRRSLGIPWSRECAQLIRFRVPENSRPTDTKVRFRRFPSRLARSFGARCCKLQVEKIFDFQLATCNTWHQSRHPATLILHPFQAEALRRQGGAGHDPGPGLQHLVHICGFSLAHPHLNQGTGHDADHVV